MISADPCFGLQGKSCFEKVSHLGKSTFGADGSTNHQPSYISGVCVLLVHAAVALRK